jgi:hypothetical protein
LLGRRTNPYVAFSAGTLPRLAQRLLEREESVWALLAPDARPPEGTHVTALAMRREWVRFSTPSEMRSTGAWWMDAPCRNGDRAEHDHFMADDVLSAEPDRRAACVRPWRELVIPDECAGAWP